MKNQHRYLFAAIITAIISSTATAQDAVVRIASGAKGGTYDVMTEQLAKACRQQVMIVNVNTGGSLNNIDALLGNEEGIKVNAGWAQLDAIKYKSNTEDGMARIKTLANMHPEAVHLVALNKEFTVAKTGLDKFNPLAKEGTYTLNTLNDYEGRRIGAAGGSFVTAKSIQVNGQFRFEVVKFESNDEALKALTAGQVDGVLFVGGHPLGAVAALDKKYKLVPLSDDVQGKIASVYAKTRVSYPKMDASGVPTVFTTSAIVAGDTKSPRMIANFAALRKCLFEVLPDLQETGHKQWKAVNDTQLTNIEARGRWAWLELPSAAAAPAPMAAPAPAPMPAKAPAKK